MMSFGLSDGSRPHAICFPVFDGNGNIMAYVNTNGETVLSFSYNAFGEICVQSCPDVNHVIGKQILSFSTKYFDTVSGLLYYGHRYYLPGCGRWLSRDPFDELLISADSSNSVKEDFMGRSLFRGNAVGPNYYAFVDNNPVNAIDFLGLQSQGCTEHTDSLVLNEEWKFGRFYISAGSTYSFTETTCVKSCCGGGNGYTLTTSVSGSGDLSVGWVTPPIGGGIAINFEGSGSFEISGESQFDSCTGEKNGGTCISGAWQFTVAGCDLSGSMCIGGGGGGSWKSCDDPKIASDETCWHAFVFVKACVPVWRYCKTWIIVRYDSCHPRTS